MMKGKGSLSDRRGDRIVQRICNPGGSFRSHMLYGASARVSFADAGCHEGATASIARATVGYYIVFVEYTVQRRTLRGNSDFHFCYLICYR